MGVLGFVFTFLLLHPTKERSSDQNRSRSRLFLGPQDKTMELLCD